MGLPLVLLSLIGLLPVAADVAQPVPTDEAQQIALKEVDERMTVPVRIAGAGPYRFVIDTGAERTVISRQLAATLGLTSAGEVTVVAMSGRSRVGTVVIPSLRLSSVPEVGRIQAPALDAVHLGGMGLLGIDTLQGHKVTIDLDGGSMAVSPSVRRKRSAPAVPGEIVVRAKSTLGQLIVTDADVDGSTVRVVLDTGSAVSIGNSALRRLMQRRGGKLEPLTMYSATGGEVRTDYSRAGRIRLGGVHFTGMPVAFADVAPFEYFGLDKRPALLLGMNALKLFRRVDIDFPNREARFLLPRNVARTLPCGISSGGRCTG